MPKNAIFLTGWEYNRLLGDHPEEAKISSLPAQVLWHGAAQFWMFEKIYCTKESLAGELAAFEELGWTSGLIFEDLRRRGFLTTVDWADMTGSDQPVRHRLHQSWAGLRRLCDRTKLLEFLRGGHEQSLETIKSVLMAPLAERLNCVQNVTPNSISLWMGVDAAKLGAGSNVHEGLDVLAAPIIESQEPIRTGFTLCDAPGTGVSAAEFDAQRKVVEEIEKPLIVDLLAGILSQKDYLNALRPWASAYAPVNDQLKRTYFQRVDQMERLRDIAKKYLWSELHNEWIPQLESDPSFLPIFKKRLRTALQRSEYDLLLKTRTDVAVTATSVAAGLGALSATLATGLAAGPSTVIAAAVGATTYRALDARHVQDRKETDSLTLFYQKARRT